MCSLLHKATSTSKQGFLVCFFKKQKVIFFCVLNVKALSHQKWNE